MKATRNRLSKMALAVDYCIRSPDLARKTLASLYNARIVTHGRVPSVPISELVGAAPEVRLVNFTPEHGNVTPLELFCICMIVRARAPAQVLELGTFNGNTTLQIAANLDPGACIVTVDLPLDAAPVDGNDAHDAGLIRAAVRREPRYLGSAYADRVQQNCGNTLELDFAKLTEKPPNLIFIDAGHSDACVRNDTAKSLDVLAPGGCIIWHDYTQDWPDVFNFLNEIAGELTMQHVVGTSLVIYRDTGK